MTFVDQMARLLKVDISQRALIAATRTRLRVPAAAADAVTRDMVRCIFDLDLDLGKAFQDEADRVRRAETQCGESAAFTIPPSVGDLLASATNGVMAQKIDKPPALSERAAAAQRRMAYLVVRDAAKRPENFDDRVQFVVATMPDPVDSFAGWQFDPTLAALSDAAAASGYTLSQFAFPDAGTPTPSQAVSDNHTAHETFPAVVLFRGDANKKGQAISSKLLVLLLAYETPTSGIHRAALASALRIAIDWDGGTDAIAAPLLLLGPYFSGSRESLRAELRAAAPDLGKRPVRVVAGSATAKANQNVIATTADFTDGYPTVTFQATVHSSDVLRDALWSYLQRIHPTIDSEPVVWLTESNTVFGGAASAGLPGTPIVVPFPMHISRISTDAPPPKTASAVPQRFTPLVLDDEIRATDQLPFFSPRTTRPYVERVLANALGAIKRERVGFVGIIATDVRDKLFLAREIGRDAPNVTLFTTESDLLYSHPDYYPFTGGMLTAAPYPMGHVERAAEQRLAFPTTTTEGVYNALLALLNYNTDGSWKLSPGDSGRVADYVVDSTCERRCEPSVWISVVGRERPREIWRTARSTPYTFAAEVAPRAESPSPLSVGRFAVAFWKSLAWVILVAPLAAPILWFGLVRRGVARDEPAAYLLVAFAALLPLVAVSWWSATMLEWTAVMWRAAIGFGELAVLVLACAIVLRARALAHWPALAVALTTVAMTACLFFAYGGVDVPDLLADRVTSWSDGMSPVVPVGALSLAILLWPMLECYRLWRGTPLTSTAVTYIKGLLSTSSDSSVDRLACANESLLTLEPSWAVGTACAMIAVIGIGFDPFGRPLVTVDGVWFGRFLTIGTLVVEILIAAALAQFLCLWLRIDRLLDRVSAAPLHEAFERIPARFFPTGVIPRVPRLYELELAVNMSNGNSEQSARDAFESDIKQLPNAFLSRTNTWNALLVEAIGATSDVWSKHAAKKRVVARSAMPVAAQVGADAHRAGGPPRAHVDDEPMHDVENSREELAVFPFVFLLRGVVARMWDNLVVVAGAILLLALAQWGYRVQARSMAAGLLWVDVLAAVGVVLFVFIRMERDEILSHITSTTPGHIEWDGDFVIKLVVYALIPLAGLFAAQFPNLGSQVVTWLEPVQKALP